jgi:hypothetical protein
VGYPKSLQQPFRRNMLMVGGGWRGFFAPYNAEYGAANNSTSLGPTIVDLQVNGPFDEYNMPNNFIDLGWITKFKITPASKIGLVRSGYRGAVRALYRGEVGETFDFTFRESGRLAWKIATGTEMFNLLKTTATPSTFGPLSSSGMTAVPIGASGYQAAYPVPGVGPKPVLFVPSGSGIAAFPAGSYIVADDDYNPANSGLVGLAGIPIWPNTVNDVDFLRKTSDFVARVAGGGSAGGQDYIILSQPFVGGGNSPTGTPPIGPSPAAKVQAVKGFAAREGGTYVTEWSAMFVMDTMDVSQFVLYYPHVSTSQFRDFAAWAIENAGTTDLTGYELDCSMMAMAFDDPLDGETVVRYCCYYPSPGHDLQA